MRLSGEYPIDYGYIPRPFEPIERLKMNKVEELTEEIKTLQEKCIHLNVAWVDSPVFKPSLIPRYFIILNEETRFDMSFSTQCTDCNLVQKYHAKKTCPICFEDMKEGDWILAGSQTARMQYIGSSYVYYSLVRYYCSNSHCSFKGVADEWNQ